MRAISWLRGRVGDARRSAGPRGAGGKPAPRLRPRLEPLEDRSVPSTLTVLNDYDSGANSLRAAINAAHTGDTITFAPALAGPTGQTIKLTSGELLVRRSITITVPTDRGVTVSGGGASRVFEVAATAKSVALSGLTIRDGFASFMGGGILNESTLTLSDCTLTGNSAPQGGAVNNQAALTVIDCTFSSNTAIHVPASSGGAISNSGPLTVSHCLITGNSADSGGGIGTGGGSTVTINAGTTLSGNSAGQGGGISIWSGTLTIDGCTLSGNSARGSGGGIFDRVGNVTIEGHGTLTGNAAAAGFGGGIYVDNNTIAARPFALTISDCTLSGNSATQGGGIYLGGSGPPAYTVTVRDCVLSDNHATSGNGGGIFNNNSGTLTVSNTQFGSPLTQVGSLLPNTPDDIFGPYVDGGGNSFSH
jgi:hypothetical protein